MKKSEKKLIRAIHDATIDGRLDWVFVDDAKELRADLPLKKLSGAASFVASMRYDNDRTITILGDEFVYTMSAWRRKIHSMTSEIHAHALSCALSPESILNEIADALVAETISYRGRFECPIEKNPEKFVRITKENGDVLYRDDTSPFYKKHPCDIEIEILDILCD